MKRHGRLWEKIVSKENIEFAHKQARKGKLFYKEVKMVDKNKDFFLQEIQTMLLEKKFSTSKYLVEERFDGRKERTIYKLPYYPDRIIQHALLSVLGPLFLKMFIRDTFQSIPGRGTHDAAKRIKKIINQKNPPKYALKIDIQKFYPSVDNKILMSKIRKKIKCKETLWLIQDILDSMQGLPIGNYTSQYFGNFYLNDFDWWMKQEIKPSGYFRYCDDIVVFGEKSQELLATKEIMEYQLSLLRLKIKTDWQIYDIYKNGVDFVGFNFRPTKTKLRKKIANRFKAKAKSMSEINCKIPLDRQKSSIMAYKGWMKSSNGKMLWRKHTSGNLSKKFSKQIRRKI